MKSSVLYLPTSPSPKQAQQRSSIFNAFPRARVHLASNDQTTTFCTPREALLLTAGLRVASCLTRRATATHKEQSHSSRRSLCTSLILTSSAACNQQQASAKDSQEAVSSGIRAYKVDKLDLKELSDPWDSAILKNDVVLLGEHHDEAADHQLQLQVLDKLRQTNAGRPLAVGLEMVEQTFQAPLDDFVAGRIDEKELFRRTDWAKRWTWPFELYLPIFQYCKANGIRLVALNIDSDLTVKVSREGLEGLTDAEWARWVPDRKGFAVMAKDPAFKTYLRRVVVPSYYLHKRLGILDVTLTGEKLDVPIPLNSFVSNRLLWDETMATATTEYLASKDGRNGQMCVLVGGDHVKFQYGLRARIERLSTRKEYGLTRGLQVASIMINPKPSDALAKDGPLMADTPNGEQPIPFSDFIFLSAGRSDGSLITV